MRLDNAVTVFMAEWPSEGAAKTTVHDYGACLTWLCKFASRRGAVFLDELTPSLLRAAILARMEPPRGAQANNFKGGEASAAQMVAAARSMARWLLAEGVPVADLSTVKAPRVPARIQPRVHSDEFEALESAILHRLISSGRRAPRVAVARDLALINVLGETGLRAQEVCGLELSHVDLDRGEILIVRAKRRKERVLSIMGADDDPDPNRVIRMLSEWITIRQGLRQAGVHDMLWTSIKGNPLSPDQLRNVLAKMCLEAGLGANRPPHSFRRYVFTEHYRERPATLSRLTARMGWSPNSHKMVDIYTRGVELELAREPMTLLSTRQQRDDPNRPLVRVAFAADNRKGVGPPGGANVNGPPLSSRGRADKSRAANQAPSGDRRYSS